MADAPHSPGPAEPDPRRSGPMPRPEDSPILGGLASIFAVTVATLAVAVAGAGIAFVVSLLF